MKFKSIFNKFLHYVTISIFYWIYLIISVAPPIFNLFSNFSNVNIVIELSTWFGSGFAAMAGAGLRVGILYGNKWQKIFNIGTAICLMSISYWLSSMFSLTVIGFLFTGLEWISIGFFIGLLLTPKTIVSEILQESEKSVSITITKILVLLFSIIFILTILVIVFKL